MTPRLSVPTDNIFKFFALFGTVMLISSFLAMVFINDNTNMRLMEWADELASFEADQVVTSYETKRAEMLERLIEIEAENKQTFIIVLNVLMILGASLAAVGFLKWFKDIQPMEDEYKELLIAQMKKDLNKPSVVKRSKRLEKK
ncbi:MULTISPECIES: hypothetical protein [unclassified Neptuniibacter]|uniref:hypothetical protein n=1 Tax=unclassified Neptuniibacter TaxID=2630693 RepID=UPI000C564702|nr:MULTISPECIES: hypothetical protein [unclassified Neptuniibacter]MAY42604.1 hypothetical protein [Oceanospirillaceae bacterium]|tara:strand:+ start:274 stop:705 length:432 start_codon:yes stop_codon:yes gene_type:complete